SHPDLRPNRQFLAAYVSYHRSVSLPSSLSMFDTPRRRVTDNMSATPTFIGVGTELEGTLRCQGDLVVGGRVRADCVVTGAFTLSEGGGWEGKLQAVNAVIAGDVVGEIAVEEKLEIRKTARIRGRVSARS